MQTAIINNISFLHFIYGFPVCSIFVSFIPSFIILLSVVVKVIFNCSALKCNCFHKIDITLKRGKQQTKINLLYTMKGCQISENVQNEIMAHVVGVTAPVTFMHKYY